MRRFFCVREGFLRQRTAGFARFLTNGSGKSKRKMKKAQVLKKLYGREVPERLKNAIKKPKTALFEEPFLAYDFYLRTSFFLYY